MAALLIHMKPDYSDPRVEVLTTVKDTSDIAISFQNTGELVTVFDGTEEGLAALPAAALVAVWNAYSDRAVKKFESREAGARRLGTLLREKFGVAQVAEAPAADAEPETPACDITPPPAASAELEPSAPVPGGTIKLLHAECKSAEGTKRAARWAAYKKMNGRTVAEFVKAGGSLLRLRTDARRGVVAVER
jgi:hypothetical protein